MKDDDNSMKENNFSGLRKWIISPLLYGFSGMLIPSVALMLSETPFLSEQTMLLFIVLLFFSASALLVKIEGIAKPTILDHIRQSMAYYVITVALSVYTFSVLDNWIYVLVLAAVPIVAIIVNAVSLYWKYLPFSISDRSRRIRIIFSIITIAFIFEVSSFSSALLAWKRQLARTDYLEIYAGCHARAFNLASYEPDPEKPTQTIGMRAVNNNWKQDSQEWHFNHDDVVEYMMQHCPPKSDAEIESLYSYLLDGTDRYPDMDERKEGQNRINGEKSVRDYQLKFINRDLDVFHE